MEIIINRQRGSKNHRRIIQQIDACCPKFRDTQRLNVHQRHKIHLNTILFDEVCKRIFPGWLCLRHKNLLYFLHIQQLKQRPCEGTFFFVNHTNLVTIFFAKLFLKQKKSNLFFSQSIS